jgi:hypothetical protein
VIVDCASKNGSQMKCTLSVKKEEERVCVGRGGFPCVSDVNLIK